MGSNSALNAEPFSLRGQPQDQPASGTNRFGLTFISAPYIPGLTKPSGKDTVFLTLSGSRNSNPVDEYATVPTDAERAGDFSGAGLAPIFDPLTKQQFSSNGTLNVIPQDRLSPQATALLQYFPEPNIAGAIQNYHLLSTAAVELDAGRNPVHAKYRYECLAVRIRGRAGWRRRAKRGAAEPGTAPEHQCQLQLEPLGFRRRELVSATRREDGVGFGFAAGWLHDRVSQVHEHLQRELESGEQSHDELLLRTGRMSRRNWEFWGRTASALNVTPLNYGLPSVQLSDIAGLNEQQPRFAIAQTISVSETLSWIHGKHNLRFGGDYRRVHNDFLSSSNATGSFAFTGLFTENAAGDQNTGSSFADFLLGLPQQTALNAAVNKSYLRDNVFDVFAMDDWRWLSSLYGELPGCVTSTLLRTRRRYGRLAEVATNPADRFHDAVGGAGGASWIAGCAGVSVSHGHLRRGLELRGGRQS